VLRVNGAPSCGDLPAPSCFDPWRGWIATELEFEGALNRGAGHGRELDRLLEKAA